MKNIFLGFGVIAFVVSLFFAGYAYQQNQIALNQVTLEPFNEYYWLHPDHNLLAKEVMKSVNYTGRVVNVIQEDTGYRVVFDVVLAKPYPTTADVPAEFTEEVILPLEPVGETKAIFYSRSEEDPDIIIGDGNITYEVLLTEAEEGNVISFVVQKDRAGNVYIPTIELSEAI